MSPTDRIEKQIVLRAPRSRVWRALTNHEEFASWFRVKLDGAFAVGQIVKAQSTYPGQEEAKWEMRIEVMEPEQLFAFTWPAGDAEAADRSLWNRVEFRLEELPEGTRLTLVESGFDRLPPERRAEAWRLNDGGWTEQTQNIRRHVEV